MSEKEPFFEFADGSDETSLPAGSPEADMAAAVERMMRGFGVEGVVFADGDDEEAKP